MVIKQSLKHANPPIQPINFNWANNANVKNLLDAISSILAEEYIRVAKKNSDVFLDSRFYPQGTFRRKRISLRLTRGNDKKKGGG